MNEKTIQTHVDPLVRVALELHRSFQTNLKCFMTLIHLLGGLQAAKLLQ